MREEGPHRPAPSDERAETIAGPQGHCGGRRGIADDERRGSETKLAPIGHSALANADALDERPVAAPEIAHPETIAARVELGVDAGNGRVRDDEVRAGRRAAAMQPW